MRLALSSLLLISACNFYSGPSAVRPITTLTQDPVQVVGPTGATGSQGTQGIPGVAGTNGMDGAQGLPGMDGLPGEAGPTGAAGVQGVQGVAGPRGLQGPPGQAAAGSGGIQVVTSNGTVLGRLMTPSRGLERAMLTNNGVVLGYEAVGGHIVVRNELTSSFYYQSADCSGSPLVNTSDANEGALEDVFTVNDNNPLNVNNGGIYNGDLSSPGAKLYQFDLPITVIVGSHWAGSVCSATGYTQTWMYSPYHDTGLQVPQPYGPLHLQ
jgi:hypothetical protein